MNSEIEALSWPISRLGEGIEELARRSGLSPAAVETTIVPKEIEKAEIVELGRWIEWTCDRLGLEAEPVESALSEFGTLIGSAGPALFHHHDDGGAARIWLLLRSSSRGIQLIGPDLRIHRCPVELLRSKLCSVYEGPIAGEIDQLLETADIASQHRERVRSAMLRERLASERLDGCWILRMPPSTGFWRQLSHAHLPRRVILMLGVFFLVYGLEVLGWSVIGQGALGGRLDFGWLAAWALLVLSLIPLQLLGHWLESTFALDMGRLLKQRLLAGAMRMDLETIRQQGAGQLLGRVIESQALESLALNGGLSVLVAIIELGIAGWIIVVGAGGQFQLMLLLVCLMVTIGLGLRLRRGTLTRLEMTHDLVERMVGHRTCLAQEASVRREEQEDYGIDSYLNVSKALDESVVPLTIMPRAWLLLGLLGLAPAFVSGTATPIQLAIGLGGMLLASRAFSGISSGFSALARAGIAWKQVAPLFHAANQKPNISPFLSASQLTTPSAEESSKILVDARDLVFRYRPQGEAVLRRADLAIRHGERILLEGASGGGKSTLAALLVGLRAPESGLLLLNGLDRHTLGEGWHKLATSAPQFHENHIFTGTLAFNLLMGRRWPGLAEDLREAEELCVDLGLGDLLERMPSGLMQMVGETGWQLSHGERSRIFLVRALLQNAQLTVLDESFAALDPETLEKCINCALNRAATLMVIAHP